MKNGYRSQECLPEDKENMIALVKYLKSYHVNEVAHLTVPLNKKDTQQTRVRDLGSTKRTLSSPMAESLYKAIKMTKRETMY